MARITSEFYAIAYRFAMKLDPKRGFEGASVYAKHMCALWFFMTIIFVIELATALLRIPLHQRLENIRVFSIVFVVIVLVVGNIAIREKVRRTPQLQTQEQIQRLFESLSPGRKILILGLVFGTLIAILLIIASKQYLGCFGGL